MSVFHKSSVCHEISSNDLLRKIFKNELILPEEKTSLKKENIEEIACRLKDNPEMLMTWKIFAAEYLLLAKNWGIHIDDNIYQIFQDVSPFGNKVKLSDCWDKNCACATFPLANKDENEKPEIARVWVVKDLAHKDNTKQFERIPKNYGIFFVSLSAWSGNSCLLALNLAIKAAESDNAEYKRYLSKDWIITGDVNESERIKSVELGKKLSLSTKRTWLIPIENIKQVSPETASNKTIRSADTIEAAWNHITGRGVKSSGEEKWPENIDELHVLVGGNIKAQVASIVLTKCRKIVLWHSESEEHSINPTKQIEYVVKEMFPDALIYIKLLSSKSMVKAEQTLKDHFKHLSIHKKILFNVTSGNRLMSYAVQTIARLYPNIDLIYRDLDETIQGKFTILNYREFPPYAGSITGKSIINVNHEFLYGRELFQNGKDFLEKILNTEGK